MTWIVTRTGKRFDLLDPKVEQVELNDIAHALSNICRFGGHTVKHYSVAQHSVIVASMVPANRKMRLAALFHDSAEAYVGDMVSPLKHAMPNFSEAEDRVAAVIQQKFGVANWDLIPQIKRADYAALKAEKEDLLPYHPDEWVFLRDIARYPEHVRPLQPCFAEEQWLGAVEWWLKQPE